MRLIIVGLICASLKYGATEETTPNPHVDASSYEECIEQGSSSQQHETKTNDNLIRHWQPWLVESEGNNPCRSSYRVEPPRLPDAQAYSSSTQKVALPDSSAGAAEQTQLEDHTRYRCNFCAKSFGDEYAFKVHENRHTRTKLSCSSCSKSFKKGSSLRRHMKFHSQHEPVDSRFSCKICHKKFSSKLSLKTHEGRNENREPLSCETCGETFCREDSLRVHRRTHLDRPYSCDICRKSFAHFSYLRQHQKVHTSARPYSCEICRKAFSQKCDLNRHMRSHTGEKPFLCEVCGHKFTCSSHLNSHMKTHSDETRYLCEVCGCNFKGNPAFMEHLRRHIDDRPYLCEICGKSFTRLRVLKIHGQKAHASHDLSPSISSEEYPTEDCDEITNSGVEDSQSDDETSKPEACCGTISGEEVRMRFETNSYSTCSDEEIDVEPNLKTVGKDTRNKKI